jgi:PAS domain S-box-containing protein
MSVTSTPRQRHLRRISRQTGLVVAFLFVLANSAFALFMLREVRKANERVTHTQAVMLELQDVRELVRQAGADQRGYLFTGDRQYLETYERAERALPETLEKLHSLVSENAEQAGPVAGLAERVVKERNRLASSIADAHTGSAKDPNLQDLIASRQKTDDLAASVEPLIAQERSLLETRIASSERRSAQTSVLISLGTVISLIVIALMIYRMLRDARTRSAELAGTDAALRDSEQRFRRIFQKSPLGIVLAERASQRIVQANPAFYEMLGYEPGELIGRPIAEFTHIDDRDLLTTSGQQTALPGHFIETRYLTRSGVVTWARVRITSLSAFDRREALLLCLVEDITRQKQVESELRQAQKMEAIGQLTGGIAHDFNNLLGVIIGNVEFLIDALQDHPDSTELAKEILNSALSGADLTRRLLAFARRQTLQPRRIDLNTYLPHHITLLQRLFGETIHIATRLADDLWYTRADPSQIGDALLNMAINSRDAMPHGGTIRIETSNEHLEADEQDTETAPGDYVALTVTDTGIGMPPEVLERIVEPFFTTKGPGAGSGLGLSMIYGFAKQSGGHLRIDSEPGHGTTVRLYLPRAQGVEADEVDEEVDVPLSFGHEAILLVDDNQEMRAVARRHLASLGYRVSEAASGSEALAILQAANGSFDLLFTDIAMPEGMTGYQLATAAQQLRPRLKVLFTTGYALAMAGGEPAVLPHPGAMIRKPYRKQDLAASVRATLEG